MEDVLGVSIVEYRNLIHVKAYTKALSVLTGNPGLYVDYIIDWTITNALDDDPAFVLLLNAKGYSFVDAVQAAIAANKPKTLYMLLSKNVFTPTMWTLTCTLREQKRCCAVILIEGIREIPMEGLKLVSALSHAKRATYALLKSYKMLGKDVMRIIAKIVWGSRANINWE